MEFEKLLNLDFLSGNFGLERETMRVRLNGDISDARHPFKNKWTNLYFQVDFAEAQLEIITPVTKSYQEAFSFLKMQNYLATKAIVDDEYLLNYSLPLKYEDINQVPIASSGITKMGRDAHTYRKHIMSKYSHQQQLISGIHFNFSFNKEFLKELAALKSIDVPSLKNEIYFKGYRQFIRHQSVITYLFGVSNCLDEEYQKMLSGEKQVKKIIKHIRSFRNSKYGYPITGKTLVSSNNYKDFKEKLNTLLNNKQLLSKGEIFQPIRLKTKFKDIVEYLEVRNIDIDPSTPLGMKMDVIKFTHLFLVFLMLDNFSDENEVIDNIKFAQIIERNNNIALGIESHEDLKEVHQILKQMETFYSKIKKPEIHKFVNHFIKHQDQIISHTRKKFKTLKELTGKLSEYKKQTLNNEIDEFDDKFKNLELSTRILLGTALTNSVKILKVAPESNLLCLENQRTKRKEYIIQATRTCLNSEVGTLLIQDKAITKYILKNNNILVPYGVVFESLEAAKKAENTFVDKEIVVKPKSANFSDGVTILNRKWDKHDYEKAVKLALTHSKSVLVEEFVEGKEYRFLVIDDKVAGVLERRPANVVGDGIKTIKELIDDKNKHEKRGKNYEKPLEKIATDKMTLENLEHQALTLKSKLPNKEIAWLRYNSNVSSGGETIDATSKTNVFYKKIAIKISKILNLKITGIDIIIKNNTTPGDYRVLEVNDNPAIHIHHFPLEGKSIDMSSKILKALKLI